MRCALVDAKTGQVLDTIVADPDVDPAPAGTLLIALGDAPVDMRFTVQANGDFVATVTAAEVQQAAATSKAAALAAAGDAGLDPASVSPSP